MITPRLHNDGEYLVDDNDIRWFCLDGLKKLIVIPEAKYYWIELAKYPLRGSKRVQLRIGIFWPRYRFDDSDGDTFFSTLYEHLSFLDEQWKTFYFRMLYI